jgi:hypothetical protein
MTPEAMKSATDVSETIRRGHDGPGAARDPLAKSPEVGAARHEPTPDADIGSMSQVRRTSPG